MNKNYFDLIKVIASNVFDQQEVEGVDWSVVYGLARNHSLSHVLKSYPHRINVSPELKGRMDADFIAATSVSVNQEFEVNKVIKALNSQEIKHVLMKGWVLKDYYPYKEMRSMGDVDILIQEKDIEEVRSLMRSLGFAYKKSGCVDTYNKGIVEIEIHTLIIYDAFNDKIDYFKNAWDYARLLSGNTYVFTDEYHFVLVISHLAKHFYARGSGIRSLLDIAVFYSNVKLDWDFVWAELEKIDIAAFTRNVFYVINTWFNLDLPNANASMPETLYLELCDFVFFSGTYGFGQQNRFSSTLRLKFIENPKVNKTFIGLVNKALFLFPTLGSMKVKYTYLRILPFLLPIAWMDRAIRSIIDNEKPTGRMLRDVFTVDKVAREEYELFKRIGL